jgi:hypothetical protein
MKGVSESLAGRVAVLNLLPLSQSERSGTGASKTMVAWLKGLAALSGPQGPEPSLGAWLLKGGFPTPCLGRFAQPQLWFSSYLQTYLERDVRSLVNLGDLAAFERFVRLCAARIGQLVNQSDLSRDAGISQPTAAAWLSVLEASHVVLLLRPYHRNLSKRLVKAPKLYFVDTGLAAHLCGARSTASVLEGPLAGPLFENMVVAEFFKAFAHHGEPPALWYYRTHDGLEVDLLAEVDGKVAALEVKATATPSPVHGTSLKRLLQNEALASLSPRGYVICRSPQATSLCPGVHALPWWKLGA